MCDEAIDDSLAVSKFISNWFVTSKMLEKLDNDLHTNYYILFYNQDFDKVTFIANERHILASDVDKINLDNDKNFDEDSPGTIIYVRLFWLGVVDLKNAKHLKRQAKN